MRPCARDDLCSGGFVTQTSEEWSVRPPPGDNVRFVDTVQVSIIAAISLKIARVFLRMRADPLQLRCTIDDIYGQAIAVDLVVDGQFHRRVDISLFLVSAHVHIDVIGAPVCQPVNQPRVAVEVTSATAGNSIVLVAISISPLLIKKCKGRQLKVGPSSNPEPVTSATTERAPAWYVRP